MNDLVIEGGMDSVYLDFSKVFDKVETGVLLHKLRNGNIVDKDGMWISDFLDQKFRKQAFYVDGTITRLSSVVSAVPKGTVLVPVLFLLNIADIE